MSDHLTVAQRLAFFKKLEQNSSPPVPQRAPIKINSSSNFNKLRTIQASSFGESKEKVSPINEDSIKIHKDFNDIPSSVVLLVGQTGGGKRYVKWKYKGNKNLLLIL